MWEIFEKLCAEMGVTPYKVAKDTGITQSTIYNWKTRNNLIGVERGQKIADYFGVSLEYLMTGNTPLTQRMIVGTRSQPTLTNVGWTQRW